MDTQSLHVTLARLELRVENLEKNDTQKEQQIAANGERLTQSEKREIETTLALKSIIRAKDIVTATAIVQVCAAFLSMLFLAPVVLERVNTNNPHRPPLTIGK